MIFECQNDAANAAKVYQYGIRSCTDNKLLSDRLNALTGGRARVVDPGAILEVNDSTFFVQPAEKIANDYIADAPTLPAHVLKSEFASDDLLRELAMPHQSLF
jgi:hypothetical protein